VSRELFPDQPQKVSLVLIPRENQNELWYELLQSADISNPGWGQIIITGVRSGVIILCSIDVDVGQTTINNRIS
jgi:hypothetical protein